MSTLLIETDTRGIARIETLPLRHGATLRDISLAYEIHGDASLPAVLVLGGISAGRHLAPTDGDPRNGWWPGVVGDGCALDPARYRLIGIDYIGGRGDSSRPDSHTPWPPLDTTDQAAAIVALLDHLGIHALHAAVGASYGGMVALALAARAPTRVGRVIAIAAAHRPHPLATAIRSVQRRIVRFALEHDSAQDGVSIARALAMTTYRSAYEFHERFVRRATVKDREVSFDIDAYLDRHAARYSDFDAHAFLTLSTSLDLHDVDPADIRAACTLVCFDSDTLVPAADVRTLAGALGERASLTCLTSQFGHDGFLKEIAAVSGLIRSGLDCAEVQSVSRPATAYAARAAGTTRRAATAAARAGIGSDVAHGAVIAPIHLSSTFEFAGFRQKRAYDYTRSGNPTRDLLAVTIAELEEGDAGIVTSTGMSAIAVTLNLLEPGDLLIAPHDGYGGTYRLLRALARRHAFDVAFIDLSKRAACDIIRSRRPRMVWIESPSNPLLRITDIAAVADAAHDAGALCVADNTFLSPALQKPIAFGADIVVHSTTKYLNGHSDVVGGAIVARDAAVAEQIGWWANCTGASGAPFDSYLTLRGLRTLHARMRAHLENAATLVDLLCSHDAVCAVHYPGLTSHPGYDIACRQQSGFGAMISFELAAGPDAIEPFLDGLRHFSLAESLGGVESLIAHPETMTHAAMDAGARHAAGIRDSLLRISVGIEDAADLESDLREALDRLGS